jgi:hypothetical protein
LREGIFAGNSRKSEPNSTGGCRQTAQNYAINYCVDFSRPSPPVPILLKYSPIIHSKQGNQTFDETESSDNGAISDQV